jgi:crotonobetainyl-CoA:carnitine CoA-transferase CaiB-like acyl-CoA transferase
MSGLFGAMTAIATPQYRNATGEGAYIDPSGADGTLAVQSPDDIQALRDQGIA